MASERSVLSIPSLTTQQTPCDTLPVPQNLVVSKLAETPESPIRITQNPAMISLLAEAPLPLPVDMSEDHAMLDVSSPANVSRSEVSNRKLCVRHKRMADEGANVAMQQSLDALPYAEREAVNKIWSTFSSASHPSRALILKGILTMCCFSQLSLLSQELHNIIRIDPFSVLPHEIALQILAHLDAISLGRAAQVSRKWKKLADDDVLWKSICEQHIDKKCTKCGWGLPLMKRSQLSGLNSRSNSDMTSPRKRRCEGGAVEYPAMKRQKTDSSNSSSVSASPSTSRESTPQPGTPSTSSETRTKPWKNVYCERLKVERNWRSGRCCVRTLKGHLDGVMCLQLAENLSTVKYPVLITGSYDHTIRVWNVTEGKEIRCITGHTRAIRALQFDEVKLITGSMDSTLRIWKWKTGECVKELRGHSQGVVSLNFDDDVLVSGSVDTTIRVWNFRSKSSFVLSGHLDWVNSVILWEDPTKHDLSHSGPDQNAESIAAGKMLFSSSDDGVIRLWDLAARLCVRAFTGHTGQVQSLKLLTVDRSKLWLRSKPQQDDQEQSEGHAIQEHPYVRLPSGMPGFAPANVSVPSPPPSDHPGFLSPQFLPPDGFDPVAYRSNPNSPPTDAAYSHIKTTHPLTELSGESEHSRPVPVLVSGALDNTIRVWDVESGQLVNTLFGHIEGVWSVTGDKLRVVSGSHDRTIKIWEQETGNCQTTLVGHRGAVTCIALADDKIISGSDDGDIKIWDFSVKE